MRAQLALAGIYVTACGGAATPDGVDAGARDARATLPQPEQSIDYDLDSDVYRGERDVEKVPYPVLASPRDARTAALAVRRYYAAAAAGDTSEACALLYLPLAESIAEDYGSSVGGPAPGETCPRVLARLFGRQRSKLHAESATVKVREVRLLNRTAAVRLAFGEKQRSDYMYLVRERGAWKVGRLFADEYPIERN